MNATPPETSNSSRSSDSDGEQFSKLDMNMAINAD